METKRTVSKILSEARAKAGLSADDISRTTYIPSKYLSMMEEGRWDALPSLTHLRGYLKIYLSALKLDPALMKTFEAELFPVLQEISQDPQEPRSGPQRKTQPASAAPFRKYGGSEPLLPLPLVSLFLVAAAVLVAVPGIVFHTLHARSRPVPETAASVAALPDAKRGIRSITVIAIEPVWVRVAADGVIVCKKLFRAGERRTFSGRVFFLRVGNAGGFALESDGARFGPFGGKGEVIDFAVDDAFFVSGKGRE
jgi:hypothetical protein